MNREQLIEKLAQNVAGALGTALSESDEPQSSAARLARELRLALDAAYTAGELVGVSGHVDTTVSTHSEFQRAYDNIEAAMYRGVISQTGALARVALLALGHGQAVERAGQRAAENAKRLHGKAYLTRSTIEAIDGRTGKPL